MVRLRRLPGPPAHDHRQSGQELSHLRNKADRRLKMEKRYVLMKLFPSLFDETAFEFSSSNSDGLALKKTNPSFVDLTA